MTLTIDLPTLVLQQAVSGDASKARQEMIEVLAVRLYVEGELPVGKAMNLTGLSRRQFEEVLKRQGACRPFDETELSRDLAWGDR